MYWDKVVSGATSLDQIRWKVRPFFLFVSRSFLCFLCSQEPSGGSGQHLDRCGSAHTGSRLLPVPVINVQPLAAELEDKWIQADPESAGADVSRKGITLPFLRVRTFQTRIQRADGCSAPTLPSNSDR